MKIIFLIFLNVKFESIKNMDFCDIILEDMNFKYQTFVTKNRDKYLRNMEYEKYLQFRSKTTYIINEVQKEIVRVSDIIENFPKNLMKEKHIQKLEELNQIMNELKENLRFIAKKLHSLEIVYDKTFIIKYNLYTQYLKNKV